MDLSNIALAVSALVGLLLVMVQFGFDMADHGSPAKPRSLRSDETGEHRIRKAA